MFGKLFTRAPGNTCRGYRAARRHFSDKEGV